MKDYIKKNPVAFLLGFAAGVLLCTMISTLSDIIVKIAILIHE